MFGYLIKICYNVDNYSSWILPSCKHLTERTNNRKDIKQVLYDYTDSLDGKFESKKRLLRLFCILSVIFYNI